MVRVRLTAAKRLLDESNDDHDHNDDSERAA